MISVRDWDVFGVCVRVCECLGIERVLGRCWACVGCVFGVFACVFGDVFLLSLGFVYQ